MLRGYQEGTQALQEAVGAVSFLSHPLACNCITATSAPSSHGLLPLCTLCLCFFLYKDSNHWIRIQPIPT